MTTLTGLATINTVKASGSATFTDPQNIARAGVEINVGKNSRSVIDLGDGENIAFLKVGKGARMNVLDGPPRQVSYGLGGSQLFFNEVGSFANITLNLQKGSDSVHFLQGIGVGSKGTATSSEGDHSYSLGAMGAGSTFGITDKKGQNQITAEGSWAWTTKKGVMTGTNGVGAKLVLNVNNTTSFNHVPVSELKLTKKP